MPLACWADKQVLVGHFGHLALTYMWVSSCQSEASIVFYLVYCIFLFELRLTFSSKQTSLFWILVKKMYKKWNIKYMIASLLKHVCNGARSNTIYKKENTKYMIALSSKHVCIGSRSGSHCLPVNTNHTAGWVTLLHLSILLICLSFANLSSCFFVNCLFVICLYIFCLLYFFLIAFLSTPITLLLSHTAPSFNKRPCPRFATCLWCPCCLSCVSLLHTNSNLSDFSKLEGNNRRQSKIF